MTSEKFVKHILTIEGAKYFNVEEGKRSQTVQGKKLVLLSREFFGKSTNESFYVAAHEASHVLNNHKNKYRYFAFMFLDFIIRPVLVVSVLLGMYWFFINNDGVFQKTFLLTAVIGLISGVSWGIVYYMDEDGAIKTSNILLKKHFTNFTGNQITIDINKFNKERYDGMGTNIVIIVAFELVPLFLYYLVTHFFT
jgi:hypothetical protein